jgi:hypothetical protein
MTLTPLSENAKRWRRVRPWLLSVLGWALLFGGLGVLAAAQQDRWTGGFSWGAGFGMFFGAAIGGIGHAAGGAWRGALLGSAVLLLAGGALLPFDGALGGLVLGLGLAAAGPAAFVGAAIEARQRRLRGSAPAARLIAAGYMLTYGMGAVTIPNYVMIHHHPSRARGCQGNLRQIDNAKQQWAMDKKKTAASMPRITDLVPTYLKNTPACPSGGTYTLGRIDRDPTCSSAQTDSEHRLPF